MSKSGTHTTVSHAYSLHLSLLENDNGVIASSRKRLLEINGLVNADGDISFKKRNVSATRNFPRGCGRFLPARNASARHTLCRDCGRSVQVGRAENLTSSLLQTANESVPVSKYSTQLSAKRSFPFGCGRHAQKLTAEERKKFFSLRTNGVNLGKNIINSISNISDPGRINFQKIRSQKQQMVSANVQLEQRKTVPTVWKDTEKSGELTKMKISKSTQLNVSENANTQEDQEHETLSSDLESFRDGIASQALMAAPNCPRVQGKCTPRSFSNWKLQTKKGAVYESKSKSLIVVKKNLSLKTKAPANANKWSSLVGRDEGAAFYENTRYLTAGVEEVREYVKPLKSMNSSLSLIPFCSSSSRNVDHVGARRKVREALRLFQAIVRKLLQEDERMPKGCMQSIKRVDLTACKLLKEKNRWVNVGKPIMGSVPGVEIGDEFQYRVELCMIGLHRAIQGGIDYLKQGNTILATSIVASGGYDDDFDTSDVLIYIGQGGKLVGKNKHLEDQKLERGNLGLKNAIDAKTPVRVIRGFKEMKVMDTQESTRSKVSCTYTYDGFYQVEEYWKEKGSHGYFVFKFRLRRLPGQPELAWKIVKQEKRSNKNIIRKGLCVDDISNGKEKIPICVVNTLDSDHPMPFRYTVRMLYPDWHHPVAPRGCDCTNGCSNSENCVCAVKNGGEIPFNQNGAIVEAKPLIYECGPSCKCSLSCHNRVSQHGIRFPLEVFKTESRGWGVRSLTSIPSGSFICEYVGEILRNTEADQRTGYDEYLFDIGHNYNDQSLWEGLSNFIPDLQTNACEEVEDVGYTIDALTFGNVGRFINHSCSPNLYAQNVLYDHDDKTLPHIMLFAAENIPPLKELTYHYNYALDQVCDSEGNIKRKECYCGSFECTGRLY